MADEAKTKLFALAAEIATKLGGGWKSRGLVRHSAEYGDEEYCNPIIAHPDGREMWFQLGWAQKGKLHVSGTWPKYEKPDSFNHNSYPQTVSPRDLPYESGHTVEPPSINVSLERPVDAIVRDIQRRFLPEYTRIWGLCKAKCEATAAYENDVETTWATVCAALGCRGNRPSFSMAVGGTYVEFEKGTDDGVRIKAYALPVELTLKVIELLKSAGGK